MKEAANLMSVKLSQSSALTLDTNPESFFFELVRGAVQHQNFRIQPETEFYVVKLLNRFIFSESLYSKNRRSKAKAQPKNLYFKT
jgi:hypothetical protein